MRKKRASLKNTIIISFITTVFFIVSIMGYFGFSKWKASTTTAMMHMEKDITIDILDKIETFVNLPLYINQMADNLIKHGLVDLHNQKEREVYFAGVMQANPDYVYSFSFGTANGEYYGARRNSDNQIEIMRSDAETNGHSRYFSLTPDLTAGEFVEDFGKFDPRTREWYQVAKEKEKPIFSSIYKHFVIKDLAISASYPIYDEEGMLKGVLGTHFPLSKLNAYLKEITEEKMATAYIIERNTGMLVANSLNYSNFKVLSDDEMKRISIEEIDTPYIIKAYQDYKTNLKHHFIEKTKDDKFHIRFTEYKREGLDWLVIIAIPESQLTNVIGESIYTFIVLSIILLIIAILIWINKIEYFLQPIDALISTTERFSAGDLSQRSTNVRNDEIGELSNAFNKMADELCSLVHNLEDRGVTLEVMNTELEEKNLELKIAKEEAEEANVVKSSFIANISHELKTPLNVILGTTQLLKTILTETDDSSTNKNYRKYVGIMQQNCYRLLRLINNLIDMTKIDSRFFNLNLQNCNIVSIVEDITLSVAQYIESKNMTLVFDTENEEQIIAIDPDKMERIILNLLSNAIKYNRPNGSITVTIYDKEESVFISVKDTGIGIPEKLIDKIFERFSRVDDSLNRQVEGSGIGLSLVKALVEAHGGNISGNSMVGSGTEFIIELPITLISEPGTKENVPVAYETNIERIQIEFSDIYS